jgi:hypothetical protein
MVARLGCNLEEAKETLQLFDILRGGTSIDCGGVFSHGSQTCRQDVWPKISKEKMTKTYFSKLVVRPSAARAENRASRWVRCVGLSVGPTGEHPERQIQPLNYR